MAVELGSLLQFWSLVKPVLGTRSPAQRDRVLARDDEHVVTRAGRVVTCVQVGETKDGSPSSPIQLPGNVHSMLRDWIDIGQKRGRLVGRATDHHAIDFFKVGFRRIHGQDAAINADEEIGMARLHGIDQRIVEWRDRTGFLGAQSLQPRLAGVYPQRVGPGARHPVDKIRKHRIGILIIHADPAFDGDRHRKCYDGRHARKR